MTASAFIKSGILESYCLGFTDEIENATVDEMALAYPEVQQEIVRIRESLSTFALTSQLQPSKTVKTKLMQTIYTQQVAEHKKFVPLMDRPVHFSRYNEAIAANGITAPHEEFDNLYVRDLPSTNEVINFAVWAKHGHEEEAHDDRNEYIAVLSGTCDMYINDAVTAYRPGQIIAIPAGLPHHAVITSQMPMFALVQRQLM